MQDGFLRSLFGDPEVATLSAGYSRSYNRERVDRFLNVYSGNPGQTTPATRGTGTNNFPLVLPKTPLRIGYGAPATLQLHPERKRESARVQT